MRRIPALILTFMLLFGMAAGAQHGTTPADEQQEPSSQSSTDSGNAGSGDERKQGSAQKPSLPAQASNVAKNVVDTVFDLVGDIASGIGNALQSLLGGGKAAEMNSRGSGD